MASLPTMLGRRGRGLLLGPNLLFLVMGIVMMHSGRMETVSSLQIEEIINLEVLHDFIEQPYATKL